MPETIDEQNISNPRDFEDLPFTKGSLFIEDNNRFETAEEKLDGLKDFIESLPNTARPAIKLHLLSFFLNNPDATVLDIEKELDKMKALAVREKDAYKKRSILPTIGIELEVPEKSVSYNLAGMCIEIGIPSGTDSYSVFEFRPDYSYSADVQARILHDLEKLIKFPPEKDVKYLEEYAPLHVNLGIPEQLKDDPELYQESLLLSDLVSLSFVSSGRISGKKWFPSYRIQPLEKYERTEHSGLRLEIRTPSFEDVQDYRMLLEVQFLASAMISFLKEKSGQRIGKKEILLSTLWSELKDELNAFQEKNSRKLLVPELKVDDEELEAKMQDIFNKYSREAIKIINE